MHPLSTLPSLHCAFPNIYFAVVRVGQLANLTPKATTRFTEEELDDILDTVTNVFYEEEKDIPAGVENLEMERLPEEQLGDSRRKKKGKARKKA